MINKEFETYAVLKDDGNFYHFGIHPDFMFIYGVNDKSKIKKVTYKVSEDQTLNWDNDDIWGWYDYENNKFSLIFTNYKVLHICFPYGIKSTEEANQGKAYKLEIIKHESI